MVYPTLFLCVWSMHIFLIAHCSLIMDYIVQPPDLMEDFFDSVENTSRSFLFWYMIILVGAPILVTAILISLSVARDTVDNIPHWLSDVRDRSIEIESASIGTAAVARALFGREVMTRFIRDLHVYSRVAGWLLFGGIRRATGFSYTTTGADMCKNYENASFASVTCPYILSKTLSPCACEWNDSAVQQGQMSCTWYNDSYTARVVQHRFYEGKDLFLSFIARNFSSSVLRNFRELIDASFLESTDGRSSR